MLNIPKDRNKKISSETITRFIESLSNDFSFKNNDQFNRVAVYWRGSLITSYPFGYFSMDDSFGYKGNLKERGYMHVLGKLWESVIRDEVYLSYEARKILAKNLELMEYFIDQKKVADHESDESKDIKKKRDELYSQHGVAVHEGTLPQYEKEYINRST